MDWDKVRIFHAAAEAGSFTHAGEQLNMSQSAVSRQVSALERELSVPLFHRHARGLVLTEQGELLYRTAHEVVSKLQITETLLSDTTSKPSGELKINATLGLGSVWLTPRLKEFTDLYPDIRIELILNDEAIDLSMREADVAIWLWEPQQSDLIRRPLFPVHFHAYASSAYIKRFGIPKSIADLDKHRLVAYGSNPPAPLKALNWLTSVGQNGSEPRQAVLRVNGMVALRRALAAGIGLGVIPDYLAGDDPDLVKVLPEAEAELPQMQAYFVYTEELRNSKRVQVFRDFLVAKARQWTF